MPEREPQTSEKVNLYERGGLTPAHWQKVIKRVCKPDYRRFGKPGYDETTAKIVAYATKVISGEFPDSGFHHGRFLGQRHWIVLSGIKTKDKLDTHRKIAFIDIPFLIKTDFVENQLAEEIREYADLEKGFKYTLDDYLYVNTPAAHQYMYDRLNKIWCSIDYEEIVVPATPGGYLPATSSDWSRYDEHTETVKRVSKLTNANPILNLYLLTQDEVDDPLHTSPEEFESILRGVPVGILNERLKGCLGEEAQNHQSVGGWEKEI